MENSSKSKLIDEALMIHEHVCFIYTSQKEQMNFIGNLVKAYLENGDACLYIIDEESGTSIFNLFDSIGIDIAKVMSSGALRILSAKEICLKSGNFAPEEFNLLFTVSLEEVKNQGFKGLRVISEMAWVLEYIHDIERLMEYESKLNDAIPSKDLSLICQYNLKSFSPEIIRTAISTHPFIIYDGQICHNSYYIPPKEYLNSNRENLELIRLLDNIKKNGQVENNLLNRAFEFQSFIDGFTGMMFFKSLDNRFIWVNDNYVKSMGIPREDLLSKRIDELFPKEDIEKYAKDDTEVIATGLPKRNIIESVITTEGEKWVRTDKLPIFNIKGDIRGVLGFSFDITEEIKLERALKKSEELYHSVYDNSPLVFGIWDKEFRFLDWNKRAEEIFGWTKEEVLGKKFVDLLIPPDIRGPITDVAQDLLDIGLARVTSNANITKDGTILFFEWHNTLLHDSEGNLVGAISLGLDKTESHRAEKAVLEAKELAERANNELYLINAALQREINERMEVEDALRKAKIEADVANSAKSQFLANMSHEIRTPMNGIMGMSELLLFDDITDEQREMIGIIKSSSHVLLQIINDILDLSKIEAGKVELKPEQVNIPSLINRIEKLFSPIAKNKNLNFIAKVGKNAPTEVCADSVRLTQVISNLIGNSIKFTERGKIELEIKKIKEIDDKVQLMVSISDTGIGIKEKDIPKLFNYFTQLDDTKTKSFQGTGLGLAISKRLVEIMGGEIFVESEIGKGSTFYFTIWTNVLNRNEQPEIIATEKNIGSQNKINILLVEDDYVSQLVIKNICKMKGWNISVASCGKTALELFDNNKFDLILMDVQMPEMSGIDITKIIRRKENLTTKGHIPIIATTAYAMSDDRIKFLDAGMDDYISKPINIQRLCEIIEEWTSIE